jgi:hypothetical protein
MSRITVTLEGATWGEIRAQARDIVEAPGPIGQLASVAVQANPAPLAALPFDRPTALPAPVAMAGGPVCPQHNAPLNLKPAGVNRQGAAYSAGYRCPVSGCRTFIPAQ